MGLNIGEYLEPGYIHHGNAYIPEEVYGRVLDSLVIACIDIFVTCDDTIILGKRTRYPQADWWILGGRIRAGERLTQAAQRLMRTEAALMMEESRFHLLTTFVAAWNKRAHEPEENGTHTVSLVMHVVLSQEELSAIMLNDEYNDMKRVIVSDLLEGEYHAALKQCARHYLESKDRVQ